MYQGYLTKDVRQKKTDKGFGYKGNIKKTVPFCPINTYPTAIMAGPSKGCVIQKYDNNIKKKFRKGEAFNVLVNICNRHNTTPSSIDVDINNIKNYYNKNEEYTERELAEVLSISLREKIIASHNFPKSNWRDSIYEGQDISTDAGMVFCIKSFLKKMLFYHFTSPSFSNQILNGGLNPVYGGGNTGISSANGRDRANTYARWSRGFVFITRDSTDISNYAHGRKKLYVLAAEEDMLIDVDSHGLKSKKALRYIGEKDSPVTNEVVEFVLNQMLQKLYIPSEMQTKLPGLIRANFKWDPAQL